MDRHRGDRSRGPSRWSDGPPPPGDGPFRHPRGGGGGGGDGFFGPRHHPYRHDHHHHNPGGRSPGGFRPSPGSFGGGDESVMPRRGSGFPGPARALSPGSSDGGKFAKLFIGSVPRTATEEEIRPLFEEHGNVMEVALIKDRRTGQQQGCCFIKYATSEEADRAIRALHNQYTLPGGMAPIQVRYADGEKLRLVEHKLFVGGLNKRATEQEIEEIFAPYGRVEDVYIMRDELKQSRGCGFVKFSNREMASAAINALNGTFTMRGCDQPLIVRLADPKRPRPGESRGGPAFGGPGYGSRLHAPTGPRPSSFSDEPIGVQPKNVWSSMSPDSSAPSALGFGGHLPPQAFPATSSTGFSPAYIQPMGQQMPPLQKPLTSPQHLSESLQAHATQQNSLPYSQPQGSQTQAQISQLQSLSSSSFAAFPQALPPQQLIGMGGQLSSSQPLLHVGTPTNLQVPTNQQQVVTASLNQQILPASAANQLFQQPLQQPLQGLQQLQQQQQHALLLQSSLQSPQPVLSQHQQLQLMQPSNPNQQQGSQHSLPNAPQQSISSTQASLSSALPTAIIPSTTPSLQQNGQTAAPLTCNWTEHTSPDGFKYYYNSVTKESKWEKPEELTLFDQQQKMLLQQQQKLVAVQQLPAQAQLQTPSVQSAQQFPQVQQSQALMQFRQQVQLQQLQPLPVPRMQ